MRLAAAFFLLTVLAVASDDAGKSLEQRIKTLRSLPDAERGAATKQLALDIRAFSEDRAKRLTLAEYLTSRATEGDPGPGVLQEVATTLADALGEVQPKEVNHYAALAQLITYEHVAVRLQSPVLSEAIDKLKMDDQARQASDFTLTDLSGKAWHLKDLKGKVVLLNFWATWCPPCRKEMPDLEKLYQRFRGQGFVVLAISDEEEAKVKPYIAGNGYSYPALLDPGRKVTEAFRVQGIPRNFVFDRNGKLVAESIDMRTERQFLEMLAAAGLR